MKFKPVFKEKIWGGQKIKTTLGLDFSPMQNCGEAWVMSGVHGSQTVVSNGFLKGNELNELVEVYMDELVGEKVFERFKNEFPILVKLIDANDYLSIQVHPNDELAAKRKLGNGKSEMWYILDAEPGSRLFTGFNREVNRQQYLEYLKNNQLKEILNEEKVGTGDVFYIPAGRIHALGPGILLAEIQQTADITYRIYDWDRLDEKGKGRELHAELALDAIDFHVPDSYRSDYRKVMNKPVNLVDSRYFTTNILDYDKPLEKEYTYLDSFVIYICVKGSTEVRYKSEKLTLKSGETLLIPAILEEVLLIPNPNCRILEVYIS